MTYKLCYYCKQVGKCMGPGAGCSKLTNPFIHLTHYLYKASVCVSLTKATKNPDPRPRSGCSNLHSGLISMCFHMFMPKCLHFVFCTLYYMGKTPMPQYICRFRQVRFRTFQEFLTPIKIKASFHNNENGKTKMCNDISNFTLFAALCFPYAEWKFHSFDSHCDDFEGPGVSYS